MAFCPFCGSKDLIQESENIAIQRIKSKTHKEIELEKMKYREKAQEKREADIKRKQALQNEEIARK